MSEALQSSDATEPLHHRLLVAYDQWNRASVSELSEAYQAVSECLREVRDLLQGEFPVGMPDGKILCQFRVPLPGGSQGWGWASVSTRLAADNWQKLKNLAPYTVGEARNNANRALQDAARRDKGRSPVGV